MYEKVSTTNIINKILYDINTEFNICIRDNTKVGKFNLMVTKDMTFKKLKEKRIKEIDFNINDILLTHKRPLNNYCSSKYISGSFSYQNFIIYIF